mmetsp:Transcript_80605/g.224295  ORF Transcript_80605/g.224295 Transcript_80605/m.224295 type:complete len:250 (+) Transcript_80605:386-1135(+)
MSQHGHQAALATRTFTAVLYSGRAWKETMSHWVPVAAMVVHLVTMVTEVEVLAIDALHDKPNQRWPRAASIAGDSKVHLEPSERHELLRRLHGAGGGLAGVATVDALPHAATATGAASRRTPASTPNATAGATPSAAYITALWLDARAAGGAGLTDVQLAPSTPQQRCPGRRPTRRSSGGAAAAFVIEGFLGSARTGRQAGSAAPSSNATGGVAVHRGAVRGTSLRGDPTAHRGGLCPSRRGHVQQLAV